MPDTVTSPRSDALENDELGKGLVHPLALYSQPGCNGRIFLRQGYPSTSRTGSTRYIPQFPKPPIESPPIELFDGAGRVFRLDLLAEYRIGGSIKYWLDENPMPEPYVEGVDYLGELLRSVPDDSSAALESGASILPVGDMAVRHQVPAHSQHLGFQQGAFTPNERNAEYRNYGARRQIYPDIGLTAIVPPDYALNTADVVSGHGNPVLRSVDPALRKRTDHSSQSLFFTSRGNVPSNKIVPSLPTGIQGSADTAPVAEPKPQTQPYPSQTFPTFTLDSGQSGNRPWTPIGSSLPEYSQPTQSYLDECEHEATQARLQGAFLQATMRAMIPLGEGVNAAPGSAMPVDAPAASNTKRGRGAARGRPARRARSTTARRGRGRVAQRGNLHSEKKERGVSGENEPRRGKHDENEESGA